MRLLLLFLHITALCAFFAPASARAEDAAVLPAPLTVALTLNGAAISAEIAATPATRRRGLSRRAELPPGRGMLLVFPEARRFCLWMRDVYFPLDAAFINAAGAVVGIARMQAQTENLHCAPSAAKYALEANAGFFRGAKIGSTVFGLPAP